MNLLKEYIKFSILEESIELNKDPEFLEYYKKRIFEPKKNFRIDIEKLTNSQVKEFSLVPSVQKSRGTVATIFFTEHSENYWYKNKPNSILLFKELSDPETVYAFIELNKLGFGNFDVYVYPENPDDMDEGFEWIGKCSNLLNRKKTKNIKHKQFGSDEIEEFKYDVIEDLKDRKWFHATLAKNIKSIKEHGLIPKPNQGGWAQLNWNIQKAVYLTSSEDYAYNIASTLTENYEEDAIILLVNSQNLDENLIVIDEDILITDYGIDYSRFNSDYPSFIASMSSRLKSIGYTSTINPSDIKIHMFVDYDS